jgi:hypothetical protein
VQERKRLRKLRVVEVVSARFSLKEFFRDGVTEPRRERVVVRCDVRSGGRT